MSQKRSFSEFMSWIQIRFFTWRRGIYVGTDDYGNTYYQDKHTPQPGYRRRRWVLFDGPAEASKVPPQWHGWLHHTHDTPLNIDKGEDKAWQKPHLPNKSGTIDAYHPPGHVLAGGKRAPTTSDYQAWSPDQADK